MTHFRFRYKRVGFMRWRCRTASHRTSLLLLPLAASLRHAPSMAAWRRTMPALPPVALTEKVLQIGPFTISWEGDPGLSGHPDIRY